VVTETGGRPRHESWLGLLGIVFGGIALVTAAVHQAAGPFTEPPPIEQVIADKAKSLYEQALEALAGETEKAPAAASPAPDRGPDVDRLLEGSTAGLGALAVVLGLAGFARREDRRTCAVAAVLGLAALPWQLTLAVVVAILFLAASSALLGRRARSPQVCASDGRGRV